MISNISKQEIVQFWNWFVENSNQLEIHNCDPDMLLSLDNKILAWKLVWEIGPGETKENSLCISPNGNLLLLGDTEEIVSYAPNLSNWEFYHYKQPKLGWNKVHIRDRNLSFDAIDWTYVLLEYPDNKLECILKAENIKSLDEQTQFLAADIILTNLLGERSNMTDISFLDIVPEFDDPTYLEKAGSLKNLKAHLQNLGRGA